MGLYEVLIGKPYMSDMVTDSVVLCFFIESDKILSILRSDPAVEDFLWQVRILLMILLLHSLDMNFEKAQRSLLLAYETCVSVRDQTIAYLYLSSI